MGVHWMIQASSYDYAFCVRHCGIIRPPEHIKQINTSLLWVTGKIAWVKWTWVCKPWYMKGEINYLSYFAFIHWTKVFRGEINE